MELGDFLELNGVPFFNVGFYEHPAYTRFRWWACCFLLYEIIVGKPAPEKVMEYAQAVGMILLLSLLVFANGNDILKLF